MAVTESATNDADAKGTTSKVDTTSIDFTEIASITVGEDDGAKTYWVHESILRGNWLLRTKAMQQYNVGQALDEAPFQYTLGWKPAGRLLYCQMNVGFRIKITPTQLIRDAALNGVWIETQERHVDIRNVEPYVFNAWLDFLYTKKLDATIKDHAKMDEETLVVVYRFKMFALCKLYVLADRFYNKTTKNAVTEGILALIKIPSKVGARYGMHNEAMAYIYKDTPTYNPISRLVCDSCIDRKSSERFKGLPEDLKGDLLTLLQFRDGGSWKKDVGELSEYLAE